MHRLKLHLLLLLGLPLSTPCAYAQTADLQFFGDVLVTAKSVHATSSSSSNPNMFAESADLLRSSRHNIANLEGTIASSLTPSEAKAFHLRMPGMSAALLKTGGIDIVTLANNHTMDFGFAGLLSTMSALSRADIAYVGAGINDRAASAPLLFELAHQKICLLAFSKTLPSSFWATSKRAGTAFAAVDQVRQLVKGCADAGLFPIVAFHWGQEGHAEPLLYQRDLAHEAIDAGAQVVIGHHPHIVQDIEIYKGHPIFYSLGNFAFGSEPKISGPEGLAVRLTFSGAQPWQPEVAIVPLAVNNAEVHFQPRPMSQEEGQTLVTRLPAGLRCPWRRGAWLCPFFGNEAETP